MRKWAWGVFLSVFVMAAIVSFRDQLYKVWATPDKVETVVKKVDKQATSLEQLATLALETKARQDKAEAVGNVQIEALKESIKASKEQTALIAQLKKR